MSACSIFGRSGVDIADCEMLKKDGQIEIRRYNELVLVSTSMNGNMENDGDAFNKLFRYISGANQDATKIEMTAPVFMNPGASTGKNIEMTAPMLKSQSKNSGDWTMSFVLPTSFKYESAPRPTDPEVSLNKVNDLVVASIKFSGLLRFDNSQKHRQELESWIADNGYKTTGPYITAGYNPPWTLPHFRRNEVIIPIAKL